GEGKSEDDGGEGVGGARARRLESIHAYPDRLKARLDDQKPPRADEGRDSVRDALAERRLFVMDDVDRVLVSIGGVLAPLHRPPERRAPRLTRPNCHSGSKLYRLESELLPRYLTISGTVSEPTLSRTIMAAPTMASLP